MECLQSLLNKIQPPITFSAEISEPVARITLKKLCGSAWDECEFNGAISQNSFSIMKNNTSHTYTKGIPRVILDGHFSEENGKTRISVCPRIRLCDIAGIFIALLLGAILLILGATGIPSALMAFDIDALFSSLFISVLGAGLWIFEYWSISLSFRKSVEIIKKALVAAEYNQTSNY
ncbi:MAG: hypothetical protein IKW18_04405 [Clostridia bacterium]|nr:hypothetical protein [Clostridia bacterium]